ncbi:MAG TPA: TerB family tellurite resistance protein [Bacteroidia bacterium]
MNHKKFYIELGKLLYAIANADGKIQHKEMVALQEVMETEFVPVENESDEFGVNDAFYAEYEFEALEDKHVDVNKAFNSFIDFMKENKKDFDPELRKACIMAAEKIAFSYHSKNHYEKYFIEKLKRELKKL